MDELEQETHRNDRAFAEKWKALGERARVFPMGGIDLPDEASVFE